MIADGHGKAFGFALGPGQAHELPLAPAMLDNLTAIPAKRHAGPVAYPKWVYRCRHLVENFWARLKEWRAVATRYEKTATSFLAVIHIAAAVNWIKL
ncbi:transposase [Acetobacter cerevisiae]|uniref:Transposase n=1 Tax=Acetobacter cerevisiae TaxID=178900 RepID=A0A149VA49_9PROT|nr:transposase [Acetobacter cerevisiae]